MIVYAVYIILPDGTPIFSQSFQTDDDTPAPMLLSGWLTACQQFAGEATKSEMKSIEAEGKSFHFKNFDMYTVVIKVTQGEGNNVDVLYTPMVTVKTGEKTEIAMTDDNVNGIFCTVKVNETKTGIKAVTNVKIKSDGEEKFNDIQTSTMNN